MTFHTSESHIRLPYSAQPVGTPRTPTKPFGLPPPYVSPQVSPSDSIKSVKKRKSLLELDFSSIDRKFKRIGSPRRKNTKGCNLTKKLVSRSKPSVLPSHMPATQRHQMQQKIEQRQQQPQNQEEQQLEQKLAEQLDKQLDQHLEQQQAEQKEEKNDRLQLQPSPEITPRDESQSHENSNRRSTELGTQMNKENVAVVLNIAPLEEPTTPENPDRTLHNNIDIRVVDPERQLRIAKIEKKREEKREVMKVQDDEIYDLQTKFQGLVKRYKVLEKIGEGTFSSVYKAEDLLGVSNKLIKINKTHTYTNEMQAQNVNRKIYPLVALKKVYVTSSPQRIYSELKFLYDLSGCRNIVRIVDALRYQDQIIIVLPYCEHADFRDYYRDLPFDGIKIYMYELLSALSFVHSRLIIHRDVKPNNFLFNPITRRGVLVDFGLAETAKDPSEHKYTCPCVEGGLSIDDNNDTDIKGYPKDDDRPARRANRAGTRGFRAPEVLFKCPNQSTKIDIWSAGAILLSLISRRFPFFDSQDDVDALVELSSIYGVHLMKHCAALHGLGFDTNLPTLNNNPRSFSELVYWALNMEDEEGTLPSDSVAYDTLRCLDEYGNVDNSEAGIKHKSLFHLLKSLMDLNFSERLSADEALNHLFFNEFQTTEAYVDEFDSSQEYY